MSFITRGTHPVSFQGGTFNNVAGDLNIFSSVSGPRASCPHNDLDRKDEVGPVRNRRILRETQRPYHKHHPIAPTHSNSTFNTVGGNMTNVSVTSYGGNGLDILYYSVLQDAMHNSAERPPEPSCHPGTRNSTLDNLRKWSEDDRTEGSFLWLYGCAGIGKSSIAQSFAATCQEKGILGATFFFKRGDPGRGNWKGLIPTLAYQLAASVGELHGAIRSAVENDKLVVGQTMRHQFQKLLIAPFEQTSLTIPPILVVDGLDECEDHGVQVMLLKLIIEGLRAGTLPIRLLLASRPEAHLREVLQADDNFDICRHLELCPDAAAYADIRRYLCDEFVRIRQCQTSRGIQLENDWPGDDSIDHLVGKSSGTFIYAATVMRYVDDEYSHPAERLESVLGLDPLSTVPLDNLYKQILSTVPNRPMLRRVLHAIVRTNADWDPEEIDVALQVRAGTSRLILRGLHSLVFVPPVRTIGFRYAAMFLHASLDDFLLDPARSADLCVATLELDSGLVHSMVVFLSTSPTDPLLITTIAAELLQCIVRIDLTDDLLPVLRNVDVQQVSYSSLQTICRVLEWLKSSSPLPLHLVQTWDDLRFICELGEPVKSQHLSHDSEANYDVVYAQILSQNPQILSVLRVLSFWPANYSWTAALDLLGLKWDVLRPLCALRTYPPQEGTLSTLLDFLHDPRRAGNLFAAPQEVYQFTAIRCISRIRQILIDNQFFQLDSDWLKMISLCGPSDQVLQELEDLDIAQLCAGLRLDLEYHAACHEDFLHPSCFKWILDWLQGFSLPPHRAIEFWQQQMAAVEACQQSLLNDDSIHHLHDASHTTRS